MRALRIRDICQAMLSDGWKGEAVAFLAETSLTNDKVFQLIEKWADTNHPDLKYNYVMDAFKNAEEKT